MVVSCGGRAAVGDAAGGKDDLEGCRSGTWPDVAVVLGGGQRVP
jgi:hypothetical protein